MKSLPRPWYLTKWRKPLSLRSKNETGDSFSRAPRLMEAEAEAETPKLGLFALRKLSCLVKEEEEEWWSEVNDRRAGDVRVPDMVLVAAIAITFTPSFLSLSLSGFRAKPLTCFFLLDWKWRKSRLGFGNIGTDYKLGCIWAWSF